MFPTYVSKFTITILNQALTPIKVSPGLNRSSSSVSSSSRSESSGSISSTGSNAEITGSIGAACVVVLVDNVLVATVLAEIIAAGAAATSLAG